MDLVLELRGVKIGWGALTVLPELSLELTRGEVLCVVGPGRSGKSTLLRVIETMVQGVEAARAEPWWVGEHAHTITSCARLRQHGEFHQQPVAELLAPLGLLDDTARWLPSFAGASEAVSALLHLPLSEIPDPLRRFLSFALVAHSDAPLLLLDEPLFALPSRWAEAVHARLMELAQDKDKTMIIVTHYLPLARTVADRVMLVIDGVEIESAPCEDFFNRAQHPRTRQYIEWGG